MKISGHKTERVFERYNITSDAGIRDAREKLLTFHGNSAKNSQFPTISRQQKRMSPESTDTVRLSYGARVAEWHTRGT